ncbi:L-sorbosone dehydrogenase [Leucoagaricus sp. SymC.cos]|nr:L-sorbosone dehydrogenase [Leucoagaricus sp. SymC.cos]
MKRFGFTFLVLPTAIALQLFQADGVAFESPITVAPGINASVIFSNLTSPRGVTVDSQQNILVVERGAGVSAFSRVNSPSSGWERTVVVNNDALTHGIQVDGEMLYVSTASDVLAYKYDSISKAAPAVPASVITGLPADGELTTHTLELVRDDTGNVTAILVGSGPKTNIDITARNPASGRSQIRHFRLDTLQSSPLRWADGAIVVYGIRNPAGFIAANGPAVGPSGFQTLLVVENGASIDNVTGITPAFANDNPTDEIESIVYSPSSITAAPPFFGFPDCSTLWNPRADLIGVPQYTSLPRGAQFSFSLPTEGATRDDIWCQNSTNNRPPAFNFQAHSVPLDIKQYQPEVASDLFGLPAAWASDLFVSFHGSFDRRPPTGYGVVHVPYPFGSTSSGSTLGYTFIIQAADLTTCPGKCIRPVGLVFGKDNRLYVSSDSTGELFMLQSAAPV